MKMSTTEKVKYYLSIFTDEQLEELQEMWKTWYEDKEKYEGSVVEECVLQYMEEMRMTWAQVYDVIQKEKGAFAPLFYTCIGWYHPQIDLPNKINKAPVDFDVI